MTDEAKCPVPHGLTASSTPETAAKKRWPNEQSVDSLLHNSPLSNPYGEGFDYVAEFKTLDLDAVKADIVAVMHDSQPWWLSLIHI
jgi:catalase-peroxidase